MKVILSAHIDLARKVKFIKVDREAMTGLVDNMSGVFAAYNAARKTGVELYLTNFEEVDLSGAVAVAKDVKDKKALIISVDICTDAQDKGAYIGNVYNFDIEPLKKKFAKEIFFMPGLYEPNMDETAIYGDEEKRPSFFFGVPITGKYHDTKNRLELKTIDNASRLLIEVIETIKKY